MAKKILSGNYIAQLCRELGATVKTGISISDGLYMISEESENDTLIDFLYRETERGESLSSAVRKSERFPAYVEEMLEIGERTGRLDSVLDQLAKFYSRQEEISANIKNAVVYPVLLLLILVIVLVVLLTQVMPIFDDVFRQLGVEMSGTAKFMMNLGTGISQYAAIIVAAAAVLALTAVILFKNPSTREKLKKMNRGKISRRTNSVRFASAMAMTLSSGLDIDQSLAMAKRICDSTTSEKIDLCISKMAQGDSFDKAIAASDIFSAAECRRIAVSFRTGNTDKVMESIAADGEKKLDDAIDEKISKVEPTLVITMSVLVGLVLFSVMLPMLSVITTV